ncbi:MAG: hypothetical protein CL916_11670 [Deltaproteobacteria bacterium]|nr:hypothetical protein [Deltaproteobacteria bacterium]
MSRSRRRRSKFRPSVPQDARRVDLHMHSNRSDGRLSCEEILVEASQKKLDIICISDHDLAPILEARVYSEYGYDVRVIHGAEMSVELAGEEQHFLAYFPSSMPDGFRQICREAAKSRARRYDSICNELSLAGVQRSDVQAQEGLRSLTRLHLARAIIDAGHARTISEVFDRWLRKKEGVEHFPDVVSMIQQIKDHGGISIWAHPSIKKASFHAAKLKKEGLDGLEVFRPYIKKGDRKRLRMLCSTYKMICSGGSDSHSDSMGLFSFPAQEIHDWPASFSFHNSQ